MSLRWGGAVVRQLRWQATCDELRRYKVGLRRLEIEKRSAYLMIGAFVLAVLVLAAFGTPGGVEAAPSQGGTNVSQPSAALQGCSGFPVISSFAAYPPVIAPGQISTLAWGLVANANYAALVTPGGTFGVGTPGQQQVNPTQTTTYTLIARCGGNQVQAQATVTVQGGPTCSGTPVINGFSANPSTIRAGQATTLSWGLVANATYAALTTPQGTSGIPTPGQVIVQPGQTTTYTLTAWCYNNAATAQVTVRVQNAPPPTPVPSDPNQVTEVQVQRESQSRYKVTVKYFWNGEGAPANITATGYDSRGRKATNPDSYPILAGFFKYVIVYLNQTGNVPVQSVTACIVARSGNELACRSVRVP